MYQIHAINMYLLNEIRKCLYTLPWKLNWSKNNNYMLEIKILWKLHTGCPAGWFLRVWVSFWVSKWHPDAPLAKTMFVALVAHLCILGNSWWGGTSWSSPQRDPSCLRRGWWMYPWTTCCCRWNRTASYSPSYGSGERDRNIFKLSSGYITLSTITWILEIILQNIWRKAVVSI